MTDLKQEISARLIQVRQHLKMSVSELAEALDVKPQTIRDYENGKSVLGGDKVAKLIEIGVDSNWLLAGPGYDSVPFNDFLTVAKKYQTTARALKKDPNLNSDEIIYIDSYPDVRGAAGTGQLTPTDQVIVKLAVNAADWRNYVGLDHRHIKVITVHGDSMKPSLNHGDQVLVDTACNHFLDDAIYAIQQGDLTRFKRVKLRLDGSIEVKSDNEKNGFKPESYSAEEANDFKLVGRVIPFKFGRFDI